VFDHQPELAAKTTDQLEHDLAAAEGLIARLRAHQSRLIREITARQVPTADGYRAVGDWLGARADVSPETAGRLVRLASAGDDLIDEALAAGEVSFDRAVELTRLESEDPIAEAAGWGIPRLRNVIASRKRRCRTGEQQTFADRYLVMQPNLDQTTLRLWGELV
jgi:hypothetical protein